MPTYWVVRCRGINSFSLEQMVNERTQDPNLAVMLGIHQQFILILNPQLTTAELSAGQSIAQTSLAGIEYIIPVRVDGSMVLQLLKKLSVNGLPIEQFVNGLSREQAYAFESKFNARYNYVKPQGSFIFCLPVGIGCVNAGKSMLTAFSQRSNFASLTALKSKIAHKPLKLFEFQAVIDEQSAPHKVSKCCVLL